VFQPLLVLLRQVHNHHRDVVVERTLRPLRELPYLVESRLVLRCHFLEALIDQHLRLVLLVAREDELRDLESGQLVPQPIRPHHNVFVLAF
jgi:hypothetical protein